MIAKKTIEGYVVQEFDTELGKFISQDFIAEESEPAWADDSGVKIDEPKDACELLVILEQPPSAAGWYTALLARIPTSTATPFMVAVEAKDRKQAQDRICKIYSMDIYSGYYSGTSRAEAVSMNPTNDPDDLCDCYKHKLE